MRLGSSLKLWARTTPCSRGSSLGLPLPGAAGAQDLQDPLSPSSSFAAPAGAAACAARGAAGRVPAGLWSRCPPAGLLVYFGYGIWHSKENLREPREQRLSARYVVFPSGSLEERVQPVQPSAQPARLPDTDTDTADGKR